MKRTIWMIPLGVTLVCPAFNSTSRAFHDPPPTTQLRQQTTTDNGRPQTTSRNVQVVLEGGRRIVRSNGLPDHRTGQFPNRNNPNRIQSQRHEFRMPLQPETSQRLTPIGMANFGVALNGIPFDPSAAEFWNRNPRSGWQYEAIDGRINLGLDQNNAHVQPTGAYHYHGVPTGLLQRLGGVRQMVQIGWAADGFPIYGPYGLSNPKDPDSEPVLMKSSYQLRRGTRPSGPGGRFDGTFVADYEYVAGSGDLDECNGRVGPTPEFPNGTYYYHVTEQFPSIPRYWRGAPDESFQKGPGRGGPRGGRPPFLPPRRRP